MKIKNYKCKCGENDFFFADKGNQKGIYCSYCGKWLKWADKDEQNLEIKQEPILDKIRAEIMAIGNWTTKGELPNGYLIKVIEIIDKYKAESEDKE